MNELLFSSVTMMIKVSRQSGETRFGAFPLFSHHGDSVILLSTFIKDTVDNSFGL